MDKAEYVYSITVFNLNGSQANIDYVDISLHNMLDSVKGTIINDNKDFDDFWFIIDAGYKVYEYISLDFRYKYMVLLNDDINPYKLKVRAVAK